MSEIVTHSDAHCAYEIVKKICTEVGPGLPGTSRERERAAIIKGELESHLGARNVAVEAFTLAPWAWISAYPLSGLSMLLAVVLNLSTARLAGAAPWLTAMAALGFALLAPAVFVLQFIRNLELVDPFFPKKQSLNVIGTLHKPGAENVKRLLIVSGHHDSAPANTWFSLLGNVKRFLMRTRPDDPGLAGREETLLRTLGYIFYLLSVSWFLGLAVMVAMSLIQLAGVIAGNPGLVRFGTLGWLLLAFPLLPAIIVPLFFTHGWKGGGIVPGAADNLSGSALAVAACRFLAKNPSQIPDDTEIRFISFGSEEAGLRGSRRYVQRHLDELKRLDARVLNIETVADRDITILTAEGNGSVKSAPEIVTSLVAAAERAGIPYKTQAPWLGAVNDSAPFSQAGLKATTAIAFRMPQQAIDFYHQKWDRPEILSSEPLHSVLKLACEWIRCGGE